MLMWERHLAANMIEAGRLSHTFDRFQRVMI
jgi:hypothetical protein